MTALAARTHRDLRIVVAYAQATLRDIVAYRADLFLKLVGYPARILMMFFLWRILLGDGTVAGRSFQDVFTYYLLAMLLAQMYPFVRMARSIREEIFSGDIATYLARGIPHHAVWSGRFLATTAAYLVVILPLSLVLLARFGNLNTTWRGATQFLALLAVGLLIKLLIWYAVGISAFLTEENVGQARLVDLVDTFFSGALLPLYVFPERLQVLAKALPFSITLYAPVDALIQPHAWSAFWGIAALGAAWVVGLALIARFLFWLGWRQFTGHGA